MFLAGVAREDLIPEIDEARGLVSFMIEEMEDADHVLDVLGVGVLVACLLDGTDKRR